MQKSESIEEGMLICPYLYNALGSGHLKYGQAWVMHTKFPEKPLTVTSGIQPYTFSQEMLSSKNESWSEEQ